MISRPSRGLISSLVAIAIVDGIGMIAMSPWNACPCLGSYLRTLLGRFCIEVLLALCRAARRGVGDSRRSWPPPGLRTRQQRCGQAAAAIGQSVIRSGRSLAGHLPKPHFDEARADGVSCSLALPVGQHDLAAGAGMDAEVFDDGEHAAGERGADVAHAASRLAAAMARSVATTISATSTHSSGS